MSVYQLTDRYAQLVHCSVHLGNQMKNLEAKLKKQWEKLKLRGIAWGSLVWEQRQSVSWRVDNTEMKTFELG